MIYKIDNYFKKNDPSVKAFLLYGTNDGLISEYTKKLILTITPNTNDPFSVVHLNWDETKNDIGRLSSEYNSRSLMGDRRVIVLRDADNELTKPLNEILSSSSSDTLLIICGTPNLKKNSSLVNLATDSSFIGVVACYEDRDESISSSVKSFIIEQGITCSNEAFSLLCSRLSNDRKSNLNELEKLITYVGSKKHIDTDDVKAVVFDQAASGIDDLSFYVFSGIKNKALKHLKNLLNEEIEEVTIIRGLSRHANKLLEGKVLVEAGETPSNAIKKILPRNLFYRYEMGANQLSRWNSSRLFDVLELLYKAEKDCKTTNMPTKETLTYTVLTLLSAASKLKA